jgi:hypothetical protein
MTPRGARHIPQTFWLENFGGGIDLRPGQFSIDQNRFLDLLNCRITKGRHVERRAPVVQVAGVFTSDALGVVDLDGVLYALAARGAAVTTATGVLVLRYDLPASHAFSTATLLDLANVNGVVQALLAHDNTKEIITLWHVFDGASDLPTYGTDPYFPWAHQITAPGRVPIASVMSKGFCFTPTHDVAESATANCRVWNLSSQDDLIANGYEFHFYAPSNGIQPFVVPLKFDDVIDLARFHSYLIERFIGTDGDFAPAKNWVAVTEEAVGTVAPAIGNASLIATGNTATTATYASWTKLLINAVTHTWYRIRVFPPATAPFPVFNYVQSGCQVRTQYNAGAMPTAAFVGNGAQTVFSLDPGIYWHAAGRTYTVTVGGAAKTLGADYAVAAGPSGQPVFTFTAAPAIAAAVRIDPVSPADLINSMPTSATVHVPAGTIMTPHGLKTWLGGVVTIPAANDGKACMVGLALDANGNPTGVIAVPAGSAGSSAANTSGIAGATRFSTCWIGSAWMSSAGVLAYTWAQAYDLTSRDPTWDETERLRAGTLAGADDAGLIATGQQENGGGQGTLLYGVRNRLLVCYAASSELWSVDTNPANNRLLDTSALGTGAQTKPYAETFDNQTLMPSANGIRSVTVSRQLSDDLVDRNIGDPIAAYGSPDQQACAYWVTQGQFVSAVRMADGTLQFLAFDYSPQSKIAAWSRWTVAGITSVDYKSMVPLGDRLYFRSANRLYYFDAAAVVQRDFSDDPALPFESSGIWHFNHLKRPGAQKRFKRLDVVQKGTATYTFRSLAWADTYEEIGPTLTGSTLGKPAIPLMFVASSVAPVFRSRDATGFRLEAIGLEYIAGGRSIL